MPRWISPEAAAEGFVDGCSVTGSEDAGAGGSVAGSDGAGAEGSVAGSDGAEVGGSVAGSDGAVPESPTAAFFDAETAGSVAEVPDSMEAVSAACTFRFSQPFMEFPSAPCISRTASIAASTFLPLRFFIFSIVLSCPSDICNPLRYLPDSVKTPPSIS